MSLGILPLLVWGAGAAIATAAAGVGGYQWWKVNDYEEWKKKQAPPTPPPVRVAPATPGEMTDPRQWTPAIEQDKYREVWETWKRNAIPDTTDMRTPNPGSDDGLIIAAAIVGLAAVWSLRK